MVLSAIGAFFLATGLLVGALAAHALPQTADMLLRLGVSNAVTIQLVHGGVLLCLGILINGRFERILGYCIALGVVLFCGSVYLKSFGYVTHARLAPFGGGLLILSWIVEMALLARKALGKP